MMFKNEWQPIETASKDGTDILVLLWDREYMVVSYEGGDFPWMTLDGPSYKLTAPTYWMPLPPLPELLFGKTERKADADEDDEKCEKCGINYIDQWHDSVGWVCEKCFADLEDEDNVDEDDAI